MAGRIISETEIRNVLYLISPCGINELRSYCHQRWGDYDHQSLEAAMNRLIDGGYVHIIDVNGIRLWYLRGQRVG